VGGGDRGGREPGDDVPGAAAPRLAAQKKTVTAAERDEGARAAWREAAAGLDPADLLFLDETSTHTAMARRRARAPRGVRAVGSVPRNRGPNVTLLAVLGPGGIATSLAVEGAADGLAFDAFVAAFLVPALRPGQTVVLDNLAVHKSARARASVEAAGARLLFLPPYSPDFNPIEAVFAKVKEALRAAAARTREDLHAATKAALDAVTAADAAGCYADCGFPLTMQPL
jgi:transposase